jgi:hypothetical protein
MKLNPDGSVTGSTWRNLGGAMALSVGLQWLCAGQVAAAAGSPHHHTMPSAIPASSVPQSVLDALAAPAEAPAPDASVAASWEGMYSDLLYEPPDPHGAAGPNGIIQVVNVRIAYWNKSGQSVWGPVPLTALFAGVGNRAFSFDPHALYDPQSGRFYVVLLEMDDVNQRSFLNIAVSKTSNPMSPSVNDWFFYRIENTRTVASTKFWGDYPGLGFDAQAIYITVNMYSFSDRNGDAQIAVLDKNAFLSGSTNYAFVYTSGGVATGFTLQPCSVLGPSGPANVAYFAETLFDDTTHVRIWALSNPLGTRTLSSILVAVPDNGGSAPYAGAPQQGVTVTIDPLDARTQGNAFWDNGAVWFCHTAGGNSGKALVYYYKVNVNNYPSGVPALAESGKIDGGPGEWTYQPSIGASLSGNIGIVYCQSSSNRYPTIFAATRTSDATAFDTPLLIKASPTYYFGARWGDFGSVSGDPTDGSLWVTHEWSKANDYANWSTWWAQLFPSAGPPPDGIMEVVIQPGDGATILQSRTQPIFVSVSDVRPVVNATVVATVNGTNLVFRNDGVAPDVMGHDSTYSANLTGPAGTNDLTLQFLVTAPGKTNSTNFVTYTVAPIPANDYFANATKAPVAGALYLANNKYATMETGEPRHAGLLGTAGSLWWNWTPASSTNVLLDTSGSDIDTVLAVYTGTVVSNLTPVIATNNVGTRKQAYLSLNASSGTTYRIAVASVNSNSMGSLRFRIAPGGRPDTNPPVVAVSKPLSGVWVSNFLVTVSGTASDGPPNPSGVKRVAVSLNGQLPNIATGTTNWSITFGLGAGLNKIQVTAQDGAGNVSTPAALQITYVVPDPVNDLFARALALTGSSGKSSVVSTTNATKEFGEPAHADNSGGKSVWWSYQPSADGVLTLDTAAKFDTLLALYTGTSVDKLTPIASNDDAYSGVPGGGSLIAQAVRANQTYYIAVDGYDGVSGSVALNYSFVPGTVYRLTTSHGPNGVVLVATTNPLGGVVEMPGSAGDFASDTNANVVLTAVPDAYYTFSTWSGSASSSANPLSVAVLSDLSFTANFQPVAFTDGFESGNLSHLPWTTAGDLPWIVQTNTVAFGSYAARSGRIGNSQSSALILRLTNFVAGNGSFDYRVSSEANFDTLKFYVNGLLVQQWSGELGWANFAFPLDAGTNTLEWRYAKDYTLSSGLDAAFIDNLMLPLDTGASPSPARLALQRQTDGSFMVNLVGQANQQYVVQASTDLVNWQSISTNLAVNGVIVVPDPGSATHHVRFYRAVVAP